MNFADRNIATKVSPIKFQADKAWLEVFHEKISIWVEWNILVVLKFTHKKIGQRYLFAMHPTYIATGLCDDLVWSLV